MNISLVTTVHWLALAMWPHLSAGWIRDVGLYPVLSQLTFSQEMYHLALYSVRPSSRQQPLKNAWWQGREKSPSL